MPLRLLPSVLIWRNLKKKRLSKRVNKESEIFKDNFVGEIVEESSSFNKEKRYKVIIFAFKYWRSSFKYFRGLSYGKIIKFLLCCLISKQKNVWNIQEDRFQFNIRKNFQRSINIETWNELFRGTAIYVTSAVQHKYLSISWVYQDRFGCDRKPIQASLSKIENLQTYCFNKHFLSSYHVSGTILNTGGIVINRTQKNSNISDLPRYKF